MKKILNNPLSPGLFFILYFALYFSFNGGFNAQTIGMAIGSLIPPILNAVLLRSYKKVSGLEFYSAVGIIALVETIAEGIGLLSFVNFVNLILIFWLLIRGVYLLFTKRK